MWRPEESLDDYIVKPEPVAEPPAVVSVRFTGEVEVLKPLARWERPAKLVPAVIETQLYPAPQYRLSWFHRSLVVGGGLAMAALVLASAVIIGISDKGPSPDVAQVQTADDEETTVNVASADKNLPVEEPLSSDIFSTSSNGTASENSTVPKARSRSNRFDLVRSAYRAPRSVAARRPQPSTLYVSQFTPTTLVIYIENGVIRSRTEPWLAAKKSQTF
jgi:hypothetical protein